MTHGSLFSGIGGFDLASEWMGWENLFHCEIDEFCQKILKHYWKDAKSYKDIKRTDFNIWKGRVDVISGGFPCQPFSIAGRRKGDQDERYLWDEMCRAIEEIQPKYIVGENVLGIVNWSDGLVFHKVQTDLATLGYQTSSYILPSCGINAPHRRERFFIIGHKDVANSNNMGCREQIGGNDINTAHGRQYAFNDSDKTHGEESIANSNDSRIFQFNNTTEPTRPDKFSRLSLAKWDFGTFPTQSPICGRDDGISGGLDGITFSNLRNKSIKAYGNSVVPQLIYRLFKTIESYEEKIQLKKTETKETSSR
jgi:DNA (cytosine-5)-methyltransferase 1